MPARVDTTLEANLVESKSKVRIEYYFLVLNTGNQVTRIKILNPTPGIWTIIVKGDIVIDGTYNAWLPITGMVSPGVKFVDSIPNTTIVIPATTLGSITVGAYNHIDNTLYDKSSWGPTILIENPDLVAPGVNVLGTYPDNVRGEMTGTSVASSITTGACALLLQWGIIEGNDVTLNTYRIKALLIRGCTREPNIEYPSDQWGYGRLNLINTFNQLRP